MKRILLPVGGAVLATGLLTTGLTGAVQAAGDVATDPMARNTSQAASVVSFWLASNGAALRQATAYTWDSNQVRKVVSKGGYSPDGRPGSTAPGGAERSSSNSQNVNLPKTVGKVFFVDGSGKFRWCSASSIQSNYRNLVATAAHCVYDTDSNSALLDNWVFVPGYYQGKTPCGHLRRQAGVHPPRLRRLRGLRPRLRVRHRLQRHPVRRRQAGEQARLQALQRSQALLGRQQLHPAVQGRGPPRRQRRRPGLRLEPGLQPDGPHLRLPRGAAPRRQQALQRRHAEALLRPDRPRRRSAPPGSRSRSTSASSAP